MSTTVFVYIAGPYSAGDVAENVARAMSAWHELADKGFTPYCPHLSHFLHLQRQRPYEDWMAQDLAWLTLCDAVLRLPGESAGADRETALAQRCGLPVFRSIPELVAGMEEP